MAHAPAWAFRFLVTGDQKCEASRVESLTEMTMAAKEGVAREGALENDRQSKVNERVRFFLP